MEKNYLSFPPVFCGSDNVRIDLLPPAWCAGVFIMSGQSLSADSVDHLLCGKCKYECYLLCVDILYMYVVCMYVLSVDLYQ